MSGCITTPDCVVAAANRLGESPLWDDRTALLYWVDSRGRALHWVDPATNATGRVTLPELVGSIALRRQGGLVAALQTGFYTLDPDSGAVERIANPEPQHPNNRFNDGKCDRAGRFWAGTMSDVSREPIGSLYRLHPDHTCARVLEGIIVPNSIAWSPDSKVMYFADTYRQRIMAYDFDLAEGRLSAERVFRDTGGHAGRPDGSTVDTDGCLWNAEYGGWRVVRYTPAGRIDRVVTLPVANPTSCTFGGPDREVLFITSAAQRLSPDELERQPFAGSLFGFVPGVCGIAEPLFGG